jgi:succinate dehydrogenase / fumarate reductase cytochrome b subunit
LALVLLPLAAHAALGVRRVASSSPTGDPHWPGALGRALQRVSALVLAVFLCAHIWQFQGRRWLGELDRADYPAELYGSLSSTVLGGVPLVAIGYLLGIAAAAVHFGQGLYHAALSWGVVSDERRQRLGRVCWLAAVCLFAVGALVVVRLATGALSVGLSVAAGASLP